MAIEITARIHHITQTTDCPCCTTRIHFFKRITKRTWLSVHFLFARKFFCSSFSGRLQQHKSKFNYSEAILKFATNTWRKNGEKILMALGHFWEKRKQFLAVRKLCHDKLNKISLVHLTIWGLGARGGAAFLQWSKHTSNILIESWKIGYVLLFSKRNQRINNKADNTVLWNKYCTVHSSSKQLL